MGGEGGSGIGGGGRWLLGKRLVALKMLEVLGKGFAPDWSSRLRGFERLMTTSAELLATDFEQKHHEATK